jgi:hypothetical protein
MRSRTIERIIERAIERAFANAVERILETKAEVLFKEALIRRRFRAEVGREN